MTALKVRQNQQDADRARAGDGWINTGLVFTTRRGTPIEPLNFGRRFDPCIIAARGDWSGLQRDPDRLPLVERN